MIFKDIFFDSFKNPAADTPVTAEAATPNFDSTLLPLVLTSPLWLSFVDAAGLKPTQKGFTQ